MYDFKSLHGSSPYQGDHSDGNGIFVQSLYGSLQLPDVHRLTGTTGNVHQLWGPVVPRTVNLQFCKIHGSAPYQGNHSVANGIFLHLLYGSVQLPDVHRFTGTTECVHQLWGSVASLTAGVRFLKYTWKCLPQCEHYDANGIFVHPLYGFVQLPDIRRCTT